MIVLGIWSNYIDNSACYVRDIFAIIEMLLSGISIYNCNLGEKTAFDEVARGHGLSALWLCSNGLQGQALQ